MTMMSGVLQPLVLKISSHTKGFFFLYFSLELKIDDNENKPADKKTNKEIKNREHELNVWMATLEEKLTQLLQLIN